MTLPPAERPPVGHGSMPDGELLSGGPEPFRWQRGWAAVSGPWRRLVIGGCALLLIGAGSVELRQWSVERDRRHQVVLTAALGVWASSTSPSLGGEVRYSVRVRNGGPRPLWVRLVAASTDRLRLRSEGGEQLADAGEEVRVPMSVLLTCAGRAPAALDAVVQVRRQDGGSTTAQVGLRSAGLVLDAAATLCAVRPRLDRYEMSGPLAPAP